MFIRRPRLKQTASQTGRPPHTVGAGSISGQQRRHVLGRAADRSAAVAHHHRTLQQDRIVGHRRQQLGIGQAGVGQAQFGIGGFVVAQHLAYRHAQQGVQLAQRRQRRRVLQVLHDLHRLAQPLGGCLDQGEGLARLGATGVVVDGDHGRSFLVMAAPRGGAAALMRCKSTRTIYKTAGAAQHDVVHRHRHASCVAPVLAPGTISDDLHSCLHHRAARRWHAPALYAA
ncbi:protein of unknown function [Cupriavidus taiwanensis]|uniref:Uncharacterized protein n=1 Tax=Cupriavidus taiwanensis TaxID=164546 RepID=A0A9Q7UUL9_9BURK|nr:protein of unknown function [Cupriavidus taiwanensis]